MLQRLWQITRVIARNLVLYWCYKKLRGEPFAVRFCLGLQELGLTFVKAGQILAALQLCGPAMQLELEKLWDRGAQLPLSVIDGLVEQELGMNKFASLESEPLGCASIAQVHAGIWHDGREVVAKVIRPGVADMVAQDARMLETAIVFLAFFSRQVRSLRSARIPYYVLQWIGWETDPFLEAENIREFGEEYRGTNVVVPEVVFVSKSLLVMTRLRGVTFNRWDESLREQGFDPQASVMSFLVMFSALFAREEPKIFHADPHPANLLVLKGGKVGVVDLGLVGRVTKEDLARMNSVIFAVYEGDVERVVKFELALCGYEFPTKKRHDKFVADVARYVEKTKHEDFTYWLMGMAHALIRHGVPAPEVFTLAARFGILANRSVQMFFPGSSVPDLLGAEMEMGIAKREILALTRKLAGRVRFLPRLVPMLLRDPVGLVAAVIREGLLILRKA